LTPKLPAITGNQLIKLLKRDDWFEVRRTNHGASLAKQFRTRNRVTVVPTKNESLPIGTLSAILGPKQTGLGKTGLQKLLEKFGI